MTDTTKKSAPKAAAKSVAKPAVKKQASAKPVKTAKAGLTVTVKQTGSPARTQDWAYATLSGLGLGRMNRTRTLEDTPAVRGMIRRVHHLVTIVEAA